MNKITIIIGIGFSLLLLGCSSNQPKKQTTPSFNSERKGIVFVQGKAYRVPYKASFNHRPMGKDSAIILEYVYRKNGIPCKIGDLGWREETLGANFHKYVSVKDWDNADKVFKTMARSGLVGCAHPLSNKEYEFYRSKEIQASNYMAATAQRNYNVTVTHDGYINYRGSVYHY